MLVRVAAGHSNAQIAEFLGVEVSTVRKHLEHAFRKLGVAQPHGRRGPDAGARRLRPRPRGRLERFA